MHSQLVGCLRRNSQRVEHALREECVCLHVCVEGGQHGGSLNGPRAAQRGLSSYDPPQPAVPSLFYVNQLYTMKPLTCTGISHVTQQRKVCLKALKGCCSQTAQRRIKTHRFSSIPFSLSVCLNLLHLFERKQTDGAVKGTFDRRRRKSKVACCQTPEPSSQKLLSAGDHRVTLIILRNDSTGSTRSRQSEAPAPRVIKQTFKV